MVNPIEWWFRAFAATIGRWGIIDPRRGRRAADLAWPRVVTGLARTSKTVADFAMVGMVLDASALAGMAFALAYWRLSNTLALGVSGGTISLVARSFGADDLDGVDRAIKQSLWIGGGLAAVFTVVYFTSSDRLIELIGSSRDAVGFGGVYLQVLSVSIAFHFFNRIASRAFVGADDAWTPMVIRVSGATMNILINAVLIFGLGLGVVGAALGTVIASGISTAAFAVAMARGRFPYIGVVPIRLRIGRPFLDPQLLRELVRIVTPLALRRISQVAATFLMLAILATFGSGVVAAYEVSRRIRRLMGSPNWGFNLAASSLVGQALGAADPIEAQAYGWDVLRFSVLVHVLSAGFAVVFAEPIARVFIDDPTVLETAVVFVRVAALGLLGFALDGAATGILRGSGETRWPFYAKLIGLYGVTLPVASLGVTTSLGLWPIYAAYVLETTVPAIVTVYRVNTGAWLPARNVDHRG